MRPPVDAHFREAVVLKICCSATTAPSISFFSHCVPR